MLTATPRVTPNGHRVRAPKPPERANSTARPSLDMRKRTNYSFLLRHSEALNLLHFLLLPPPPPPFFFSVVEGEEGGQSLFWATENRKTNGGCYCPVILPDTFISLSARPVRACAVTLGSVPGVKRKSLQLQCPAASNSWPPWPLG